MGVRWDTEHSAGRSPGVGNTSEASENLAGSWGRSDGQLDPERVALLAWEEARAPQARQVGVGRGPQASGPSEDPAALPGQGWPVAQRPVGREALVVGVWKQLRWASRVRL